MWLRYAKRERSYLWTEGDSYMDGAYGVELKNVVRTASSRGSGDTSAGSSTVTDIVTRILANDDLRRQCRLVVWDGSANGFTTVAAYLAEIDTALAQVPSTPVWLPPVNVGPSASSTPTAYTLGMEAIYAGLQQRNVATFDPVTLINNALNDGSGNDLQDMAARVVVRSVLLDSVHINQAAIDVVAAQIATTLTALAL
jgi:hypothetical protein